MTTGRTGTPAQKGFTIIELIISVLVFGIIVAGALGFLAAQNSAYRRGVEGLEALQNLRYTFEILETDIRTLGTNLPPDQPGLVYAGPDVIAFSADYATNLVDDIFAVYVLPDAPPSQVTAPTQPFTLPNTTYAWPEVEYRTTAGTNSPAELLIFFFRPDSSTARDDDWILFRQVNNSPPEVVARNLLRVGGTPFFRYFNRRHFPSAPPVMDSIPDQDLPLIHLAHRHGSPADTGRSALADSVRAVRVTVGATNGRPGEYERTAEFTRIVRMPNAGLTILRTCGDEPLLAGPLQAWAGLTVDGRPAVNLRWDPSVDEAAGERDVVRYVVWRRTLTDPDWGPPLLSLPAGQPEYIYQDATVEQGATYRYAVAAQDCTPTLSGLVTSPAVLVP